MVKYSSIVALSLVALGCGSGSGDSGPDTDGTVIPPGSVGSGGSATDPGGKLDFGGMFGSSGNNNGSGSGTSTEIPGGSVENLRESSCAGWVGEPEGVPSILQLVVDTSLSMNERTASTNGRTKWEITREALGRAVGELPASTGLGLLYYPNRSTSGSDSAREVSACVNVDAMIVPSLLGDPESDARNSLTSSLGRTRPDGWTPTHDAYAHALVNGLESTRLAGNRFMLLITDGAPTLAKGCIGRMERRQVQQQPTQPIEDEIAAARSRGIRTFIIGSPGSEVSVDGGDARPWMSRAATLGGTAQPGCSDTGPNFCHIDLTQAADFGAALNSALAAVAGQVVSCNYALPQPPPGQTLDLAKVNVIFTPTGGEPELILRTSSEDCTDGYSVNGDDEVVLCKATCDKVQADAGASLELLFGCAAKEVQIH